ncbi:MAG: PAS domain S-box protein, partial [Holophagales bacterium]|nr:PAS domain S-box protein [Holophagales bacterium]
MSTDGCWLEVNEALCRFLGYDREELLATTSQAITHPEDLELDLGCIRQILDREIETYRTEKRFIHSSGRVVWAQSSVSLVWGADDTPRYFIVQVLDITSQKRNESILRSVVASPDDLDGESYYREAALRIADVLGMDLALIGQLDEVSGLVRTLAVVEAGEPLPNFTYACDKGPCAEVLAGSTVILERGAGHHFADGDLLMEKGIELYGGVPLRDPNGQVIGHLAVMKRAPLDEDTSLSESLRILSLAISAFMVAARSRRQYHDLFELTPDPVVMASRTGAIILMNRNAENAFGWRREEKIGQQVCTLFSDIDPGRSSFYQWLRGEAVLAEPMEAEGSLLEARRQDGTVFPVEARYRLLEIGRGPVVALALRDVSDRQMLEQQLREARKMESIGQLTAGIAYDFKNMLTVVKITAQLASDGLDRDDPLRGEMSAILKASEEASRLTRQLLAFGRRQVLKPVEVDLDQAVSETGELLERVLGDHILLDLKLEGDVPHVKIDPCQLQQVILNLAVNSREAMYEKGGTLAIETRAVVLDEENRETIPD